MVNACLSTELKLKRFLLEYSQDILIRTHHPKKENTFIVNTNISQP
jgi:hypothetical protein